MELQGENTMCYLRGIHEVKLGGRATAALIKRNGQGVGSLAAVTPFNFSRRGFVAEHLKRAGQDRPLRHKKSVGDPPEKARSACLGGVMPHGAPFPAPKGKRWVFTPYFTHWRSKKRVYRKDGGMFAFLVNERAA
jgi:hypothetical protein